MEEGKLRTGEGFVKWLRPAGCLVFLGLFILVTVMLFTLKGTPVEGYTMPNTAEYYESHPEELFKEVAENLLPKIKNAPTAQCAFENGIIIVTASPDQLTTVRNSVVHYYTEEMFQFKEAK